MATPYPSIVYGEQEALTPEEIERLDKRRRDVKNYEPPQWRSNYTDDVSGTVIEHPMVEHASIHPLEACCCSLLKVYLTTSWDEV